MQHIVRVSYIVNKKRWKTETGTTTDETVSAEQIEKLYTHKIK